MSALTLSVPPFHGREVYIRLPHLRELDGTEVERALQTAEEASTIDQE